MPILLLRKGSQNRKCLWPLTTKILPAVFCILHSAQRSPAVVRRFAASNALAALCEDRLLNELWKTKWEKLVILSVCPLCPKGQFTPKLKQINRKTNKSLTNLLAIHRFRSFWSKLPNFGDMGRRDVSLLLNTVSFLVVLTAAKITFEKVNSNASFQKTWPGYSEKIHRPWCEQSHVHENYFISTKLHKTPWSVRQMLASIQLIVVDETLWLENVEMYVYLEILILTQ